MNAAAPIVLTAIFAGSLLYLTGGILFGQMNVHRSAEWIWPVLFCMVPAVLCPMRMWRGLTASAIALVFGLLVYSFGLAAIVGVLIFFLGTFAVGTKLRFLVFGTNPKDVSTLDLPLGLCVCVAIFGLMAQFVYLDRSVAGFSIVAALWFGREGVKSGLFQIVPATASWLKALSRADVVALAFLLGIVGFVALGCFLPTVGYDDHAFHLRLWTELANSGRMALDPVAHAFALAPFSTDLLYALPTLIAGEDTRGLVNLALLLLVVTTLYSATRAIAKPDSFRFLCIALFISTPLLLLATTTLQTEMWATFFAVRFTGTIVKEPRSPFKIYVFECLALTALLASTKLTGALLGAFLLAAALIRLRDAKTIVSEREPQLNHRWAAVLVCLVAIAALQSYVTAWVLSGNPVFPLFNGIFKSPFFDTANFSNNLFTGRNSAAGFIGMFWNTHNYLEARDGVAGFQYLFVLPLAGVGLLMSGRWSAPLLGLFVAVILYTTVSFSFQQYARYLLPVMPAASLLLLAAFPSFWMPKDIASRVQGVIAITFCVLITLLNVTFAKGAIWYLETGLASKILPQKRNAFLDAHVPEWRANAFVNAQSGQSSRVFYDGSRPYGATLAGIPLLPVWHNLAFNRAVLAVTTASDVEKLVARFGITHVFWDTAWVGGSLMPASSYRRALADYLAAHGMPLAQFGRTSVYAINQVASPLRRIFDLATPADVAKLVPAPDESASVGLRVNASDRIFTAQVARENVSVLKIETQFECETDAVFLIQINWSKASNPPHYRLVICKPGRVNNFIDVVQAPLDKQTMTLYFDTHASSQGSVVIRQYVVEGR